MMGYNFLATIGRVFVVLVLATVGVSTAQAEDAPRVAIKGYDTVAYFTDGRPVPGAPENAYDWDGTRWLFATAEHRDMFSSNPDRYAPQYDGFCALGMAFGQKVEIDPTQWTIVDDKLYLSSSADATTKWRATPQDFIAAANDNFAAVAP
jgi:hypothetical protein